jgi:hypothetical protein
MTLLAGVVTASKPVIARPDRAIQFSGAPTMECEALEHRATRSPGGARRRAAAGGDGRIRRAARRYRNPPRTNERECRWPLNFATKTYLLTALLPNSSAIGALRRVFINGLGAPNQDVPSLRP